MNTCLSKSEKRHILSELHCREYTYGAGTYGVYNITHKYWNPAFDDLSQILWVSEYVETV